jgi:starvation-inducible DNA-binding protein
MKPDIGITDSGRQSLVEPLSRLLADTYTVYLKTHNFHWNVTGPMFTTLHNLFMAQYTELSLAVDEIAERIRALGAPAPGSYADFARLSTVRDAEGVPRATDMITTLVADHGTLVATASAVVKAAEAAGDIVSVDLATRRTDVSQKAAWMLRVHLE